MHRTARTLVALAALLVLLLAPVGASVTSLGLESFLPTAVGNSIRGVLLDPGTVTDGGFVLWDGTAGQGVKSSTTLDFTPRTTVAVGAVNGTGVSLVEEGSAVVHRTTFTLAAASITVTDSGGAAGAQGSLKLYDFPEGVIVRGGCVANLTTLAGVGGITDTAAAVLALGSVAAGAGDAALSGTEADFIASFAGTLSGGAGTFAKYGEPSATSLDGHTTAVDLILNVAVPDAGVSASDTLAASGTVVCTWFNTGDF
jgi:hypothetical protein